VVAVLLGEDSFQDNKVVVSGLVATDANLKVAFIGDSGYGANFEAVLNLVKNEGAQIVLHQGDFDYSDDPDGFEAKINNILGSGFPYFVAVGNHDAASWNEGCGDSDGCYAPIFRNRANAQGITTDDPDLNDQKYSITYRGLKIVFAGENGNNSEFAGFVANQLLGDSHIWKICSWHKNQAAMQVGGKTDEMGWDIYDNCRAYGAIIATGHEHSYSRTKTLTSMATQTVDSTCANPQSLCVEAGRTFAFVSGLGGHSIRPQLRCLPTSYPYGCNGEWASIYTSNQGAAYGALFITFYVDGDPYKARGYFKNISGTVVDSFDIKYGPNPASPPAPTPAPVPSPNKETVPSPEPGAEETSVSPSPPDSEVTPAVSASLGAEIFAKEKIPAYLTLLVLLVTMVVIGWLWRIGRLR